MYRLIVSDYDGTLVTPSEQELSPEFFTKLHSITNRGTLFAVASGRPYNQLKRLFAPAAGEVIFICNDGAQIMYKNCVLYKRTVDTFIAKRLCAEAFDSGMTPILALREENHTVKTEQLSLPFFVSGDIFKLIIAKNGCSAEKLENAAVSANLRCCFCDDTFIEFCHKDADKGKALRQLMQKFSVLPQQAAVLFDGENDLPMLPFTEHRFAVSAAEEPIRRQATDIIENGQQFLLSLH